jgi:hypothetical protein
MFQWERRGQVAVTTYLQIFTYSPFIIFLSHATSGLNSKGKIIPVLNSAPHHGDVWGSGGVDPRIQTSALDGREWSVSRPGSFTAGLRAPGTHWTGGWVGPRAVLDTVVKKKKRKSHHYPCRELNPGRPAHSLISILTELPRFQKL